MIKTAATSWLLRAFIRSALFVLLAACSAPQPGPAEPSASPQPLAATATVSPPTAAVTTTPAPPRPTATASLVPATATSSSTAAPTVTATATLAPPTPSGKDAIYIFYIKTQEGGSQKKGEGKAKTEPKGATGGTLCGDTLEAINTGLPRSGDTAADITAALKRLFSKVMGSGDLINPAYLSNIEVKNVSFQAFQGIVDVDLTGTYVRTGDHCDDYRVREQVWNTIRQFEGVKTVNVLLNGNLLGDILAGGK